MAIGRLDEGSEGLLLLTTDGKESEFIRSKEIEKEYWVLVDGILKEEILEKLRNGIEIKIENGKYTTLPCKVERLQKEPENLQGAKKIRDPRHGPTSWISITLSEGKFRQIRKMTAAVGHPTLRLIRVRIGNFLLGNLPPGHVEEVGPFSTNLSED